MNIQVQISWVGQSTTKSLDKIFIRNFGRVFLFRERRKHLAEVDHSTGWKDLETDKLARRRFRDRRRGSIVESSSVAVTDLQLFALSAFPPTTPTTTKVTISTFERKFRCRYSHKRYFLLKRVLMLSCVCLFFPCLVTSLVEPLPQGSEQK